jgi:hypothetical protein
MGGRNESDSISSQTHHVRSEKKGRMKGARSCMDRFIVCVEEEIEGRWTVEASCVEREGSTPREIEIGR